MQKYTIADHVVGGGNVIAIDTYGIRSFQPAPDDWRETMRSEIRVNVDDIGRWYQMDEQTVDYRFGSSLYGPLRLPYDSMWLEYRVPEQIFMTDRPEGRGWVQSPFVRWGAQMVDRSTGDVMEELEGHPNIDALSKELRASERIVQSDILGLNRGFSEPAWLGRSMLGVTEAGEFVGHVFVTSGPDALAQSGTEEMRPFLIAVGLMNCKNVTLADASSVTPAKRGKRKLVPSLKFKTIKLPAGKSSKSAARATVNGGAVPFHMVRGHFKTYTEDAPLMGKITGTYWWSHQARGQKKNGIVVKDYEVRGA